MVVATAVLAMTAFGGLIKLLLVALIVAAMALAWRQHRHLRLTAPSPCVPWPQRRTRTDRARVDVRLAARGDRRPRRHVPAAGPLLGLSFVSIVVLYAILRL
jgi:hypothetical protein